MDINAELFGTLEEANLLHGPAKAYVHLSDLEREGYAARENGIYRRIPPGLDHREQAFVI